MIPKPNPALVFDEFRQSAAWREAEERVSEQESERRRQLVSELGRLRKSRATESAHLAAAVADARRERDAAAARLAEAAARLERVESAERVAGTEFDRQARIAEHALETSAGDRLAATRRAIARAEDTSRALLAHATAGPDATTGYHVVNWSNAEEINGALEALRELRARIPVIAHEVADLRDLEQGLGALETEALETVARIPTAAPEDWIPRALGELWRRS